MADLGEDMTDLASRPLSAVEEKKIAVAREKAFLLYEGKVVPHRSCGVALAETFGLPHSPYQALRKGGITGAGFCGSIRAGEMILGQILGDPSPSGSVTPKLRAAVIWYQGEYKKRLNKGKSESYICNDLTKPLGDFMGAGRKGFCTNLAAEVAALTAEAILRFSPESWSDIEKIEGPVQQ